MGAAIDSVFKSACCFMSEDNGLSLLAHQQALLHQRFLFETEEEEVMSLTVKDNGSSDVIPAPEGLHIARCYAVIDLGDQHNKTYNTVSPKVLIGWELPQQLNNQGKPFAQFQRYTASLSEKSNLRSLLEAWRGKSFEPEELQGFELKKILNQPCYLTIKHKVNPQTQKRWSEVVSICRLPANIICPERINNVIYFDLDHFSEEALQSVPEGIRKKINLSTITNLSTPYPTHATDETEQDVPF